MIALICYFPPGGMLINDSGDFAIEIIPCILSVWNELISVPVYGNQVLNVISKIKILALPNTNTFGRKTGNFYLPYAKNSSDH